MEYDVACEEENSVVADEEHHVEAREAHLDYAPFVHKDSDESNEKNYYVGDCEPHSYSIEVETAFFDRV